MVFAQRHNASAGTNKNHKGLATHKRFMAAARAEAEKSMSQGGVPVGSLLVRNGEIIGSGHNQRVQKNSPILHGEMDCILNAGRQASYSATTLYTTLSPCMMCSGAIIQFRIPRVIIGDNTNFCGNEDFLRAHHVNVTVLDDPECIALMRRFIDEHPELWLEDIGGSADRPPVAAR